MNQCPLVSPNRGRLQCLQNFGPAPQIEFFNRIGPKADIALSAADPSVLGSRGRRARGACATN
jgi:hypothetical protein